MTFAEIINHPDLRLPISISPNRFCDYRFLSSILNKYQNLLNDLSEEELVIEGIRVPIKKDNLVRNQHNFQLEITNAFQAYLNGLPSQAYGYLSKALEERIKKYENLLKIFEYQIGSRFYKIRITNEVKQLDQYEMFHIPFEKRAKVKTQRFSIPGFPTLYLGTSLYVCWEELLRPHINNFQAAGFVSQKSINMLDLIKPEIKNNNYYTKSIYEYFVTWPLIAACSIKVKETREHFKPEYIIPQLLLQWIKR